MEGKGEYQDLSSQIDNEDEIWNRNRFIDFIGTSGVHIVVVVVEAEDLGSSEVSRLALVKKGY